MARLYGPIDREVQIAEMRYQQMLGRLEINRLVAQAKAENGPPRSDGLVGSVIQRLQSRVSLRYRTVNMGARITG